MRMVIALALAALSAGCATKWHNPDITDPKLGKVCTTSAAAQVDT